MTIKNNLAPESQPWGRDIEKRLSGLEFGNSVALNRNANTNDGVLATLNQLSSQITTLASQQSTLNTAVSDITTLLAAQVKFGQAGGALSNFGVSTSASNIYTRTINIPAGYTQAIVIVFANMTLVNSSGTGKYAYLKANINSTSLAAATEMYSAANDVRAFGSSASTILIGIRVVPRKNIA